MSADITADTMRLAKFEPGLPASSRFRDRLGCTVTTRWGRTPERGLLVEHIELKAEPDAPVELMLLEDAKPGKVIYQ